MPRTALSLDDDLLRRLKEKAAQEDRTLQSVANDLLRQGLARQEPRGAYRLNLRGWEARMQPGVDISDR